MTLRHMKIFCAVFEANNITHAANKLYLAQPAVSTAIREIEEHYKIKCFDRIGNRLSSTENGRRLYSYASHIVELFGQAEDEMSEGENGMLRVGASITVGQRHMPDYIKTFQRTHPKTQFKVTVGNSADIEREIMQNTVDFAFIEGIVHEEAILSDIFASDEIVMTASPDNKIFLHETADVRDIAKSPLLLREKGSGTRELFEAAMTARSLEINVAWESIDTQTLLEASQAGCGIAVVPFELAETKLRNGLLRRIECNDINLKRNYFFIRHKNKYLTQSAKHFIAHVTGIDIK